MRKSGLLRHSRRGGGGMPLGMHQLRLQLLQHPPAHLDVFRVRLGGTKLIIRGEVHRLGRQVRAGLRVDVLVIRAPDSLLDVSRNQQAERAISGLLIRRPGLVPLQLLEELNEKHRGAAEVLEDRSILRNHPERPATIGALMLEERLGDLAGRLARYRRSAVASYRLR